MHALYLYVHESAAYLSSIYLSIHLSMFSSIYLSIFIYLSFRPLLLLSYLTSQEGLLLAIGDMYEPCKVFTAKTANDGDHRDDDNDASGSDGIKVDEFGRMIVDASTAIDEKQYMSQLKRREDRCLKQCSEMCAKYFIQDIDIGTSITTTTTTSTTAFGSSSVNYDGQYHLLVDDSRHNANKAHDNELHNDDDVVHDEENDDEFEDDYNPSVGLGFGLGYNKSKPTTVVSRATVSCSSSQAVGFTSSSSSSRSSSSSSNNNDNSSSSGIGGRDGLTKKMKISSTDLELFKNYRHEDMSIYHYQVLLALHYHSKGLYMNDEKNDDRRDGDGDNNDNDYNDVDDSKEVVNKLELSFCEFIDTQQLCYNNKGILIDFKTTIHTVKEAYSSIMDDVDDMNQFDMKQLINQLIIFADNFSNEFESAYIVDSVVELICVLVKYDLIIISLDIIPIITVKSIQNSMNTCKSNNNNRNKTNNPHNSSSSSSSSSSISFLSSSVSSSSTTSIIDDDSYITIDATTDTHSSLRCRDWYSQLFRWAHHQKTVNSHNIASIVNTTNTRVNDIAVNTGAIVTTTTPITTTNTTNTTTTTTVSGGMMIKKESSSVKRNSVIVKVIIIVFVSSRCSVSMFVGVIYICIYMYMYIYVDVICLCFM